MDFNAIANLPGVTGAVLSDSSGALLEVVGNLDGEAAGAVQAFSLLALSQAGEMLGLGGFQRASISTPSKACVVLTYDGTVLGVHTDPRKLSQVEQKLQDTLQR